MTQLLPPFAVQPPPRSAPPGLTFIIPNWHHELLLPRSISSAWRARTLLAQHGLPAEILIVDDHSRDGSLTLLRQLEALMYSEGVRVLALTERHGVSLARNLALQAAAYRYAVCLDADNELIAENVFHFYRAITQTGAAVVYGNVLRSSVAEDATVLSPESFQYHAFQENYIDMLALVDRLQVLEAGGFTKEPNLPLVEDWELYLTLASQGRRLVFVPLVLGVYYDLPQSRIQELDERLLARDTYLRRTYNQLGVRDQLPLNTLCLRYHPDVGYL